jgi:hypothetical protein
LEYFVAKLTMSGEGSTGLGWPGQARPAGDGAGGRPRCRGGMRGGQGRVSGGEAARAERISETGGGWATWPAAAPWTTSTGGVRRAAERKREKQSTRNLFAISKISRDLSVN